MTKFAVSVLLVLASGCTKGGRGGSLDSGGADDSGRVDEAVPLPPHGNLLIEEVYYSGAVPTEGIDRYYSDQFIELMNVA